MALAVLGLAYETALCGITYRAQRYDSPATASLGLHGAYTAVYRRVPSPATGQTTSVRRSLSWCHCPFTMVPFMHPLDSPATGLDARPQLGSICRLSAGAAFISRRRLRRFPYLASVGAATWV